MLLLYKMVYTFDKFLKFLINFWKIFLSRSPSIGVPLRCVSSLPLFLSLTHPLSLPLFLFIISLSLPLSLSNTTLVWSRSFWSSAAKAECFFEQIVFTTLFINKLLLCICYLREKLNLKKVVFVNDKIKWSCSSCCYSVKNQDSRFKSEKVVLLPQLFYIWLTVKKV